MQFVWLTPSRRLRIFRAVFGNLDGAGHASIEPFYPVRPADQFGSFSDAAGSPPLSSRASSSSMATICLARFFLATM